ncbi:MAG TPA: SDR family oxidoreductase [Methylocella sp.]|nr:SDR family oxidoreductase [Methylocella sp.]
MTSKTKALLILGGTSDIGRATAYAFAARGWMVQLAGRDLAALKREAGDIAARSGVEVTAHAFDVLDTASFAGFIDGLPVLPDLVVCAVGLLGDQTLAETDLDHATLIMRSNYEAPALILGLFGNRFLTRGEGTIVGISSVAGDRGRGSNYVYGSAKAGFTAFLSGLRNRMAKRGVHVVTVKPGFVRTKMTEGMKLLGALTVDAAAVGEAIFAAADRRRDVIYVSPVWQLVMMIIRAIPETLFKKLSI